MKTIGLTGGIACGKTTVARILSKYGVKVISADELAHQAIEPGEPGFLKVLQEFGRDILGADGKIDRCKLGEIIFRDSAARKKLEDIIHPVVLREIKREIKSSQEKGLNILIVEIPLLYEVGWEDLFDQIWVVSSPVEERIKRLQRRDRLSETEVKARLEAQLPLSYKEGKADRVIYNNKSLAELEQQIRQSLKTLE